MICHVDVPLEGKVYGIAVLWVNNVLELIYMNLPSYLSKLHFLKAGTQAIPSTSVGRETIAQADDPRGHTN